MLAGRNATRKRDNFILRVVGIQKKKKKEEEIRRNACEYYYVIVMIMDADAATNCFILEEFEPMEGSGAGVGVANREECAFFVLNKIIAKIHILCSGDVCCIMAMA